jgi:hypothetical protein
MDLSGVKKIDVKATIIRADGSQEDLGIVSSWESNPNKGSLVESINKLFKRK